MGFDLEGNAKDANGEDEYFRNRPMVTNTMRHAFLFAILNLPDTTDVMIARHYIAEKIYYAFTARTEQDLVGRLDLERQAIYRDKLRDLRAEGK